MKSLKKSISFESSVTAENDPLMNKFSIFLPTYNRQTLVVKTLNSLIAQTYSNFEILLYDNGSHPSLEETIEAYQDCRIKYKRYEENQNPNDLAEDALNNMSGSNFLFIADDDVLVPGALDAVNELLNKHEIEFLQIGVTHYNHTEQTCTLSKAKLHQFTGRLDILDSEGVAFHYFNGWGIGPRKHYPVPRTSHSSGIFISKGLVKKTRLRQRELFIKPFGDIGYVGALLNTDKCYYLDLPLAIVGETQVREMNGAKPGQRQKWNREIQYLEHSPLKGVSFVNMGADAHLKVLFRNNFNEKYDSRLRPNFYYRHLKQVLSDSPWSYTTLKDVAEAIPYALLSYMNFLNIQFKLAEKIRIKKIKRLNRLIDLNEQIEFRKQMKLQEIMKFEDINQFSIWVEEMFVRSLKRTQL